MIVRLTRTKCINGIKVKNSLNHAKYLHLHTCTYSNYNFHFSCTFLTIKFVLWARMPDIWSNPSLQYLCILLHTYQLLHSHGLDCESNLPQLPACKCWNPWNPIKNIYYYAK